MTKIQAGTHSGSFHADDLVGAAILRANFEELDFVRSRDPEVLSQLPILFDVGGEYDPGKGRFDHHQTGGAGSRSDNIPYASAGLLWKQFGLDVVRKVASDFDLPYVDLVARVERVLVRQIDAHDCGVSLAPTGVLTFAQALELLNEPAGASPTIIDASFMQASGVAELFLQKTILNEANKMQTAALVKEVYQGGAILELSQNLPWEEVVIEELPDVYFVIIPKNGQYNLKTVPVEPGAFQHRQLLPEKWAGLKGQALTDITGVAEAQFCHNGRFIAVASSLAGAQELARQALAG